MSSNKTEFLSDAMKRTSEWVFSQEIPSDITVNAGGTSFSLHKFPLVSKSGYVQKIVSGSSEADLSEIEIPDFPGGAEAFGLAAKFCYGINFEITTENIAMLRCAAECLEMTEDYAPGNLVERTEAYANEVALKSLSGAVSVLRSAENLLPVAEKVRLVSRSIDVISTTACKDSKFGAKDEVPSTRNSKPVVEWWAEDLVLLRVDMFQRVLIAMIARGFKRSELAPILMLYARKSLRGLEISATGRKKIEPIQEHEKRVVLETIVSLLPKEENAVSVSFISMLLRASIYLETTVACRLDLEKKMAAQLGRAVIDDLLIPSYSFNSDTAFDIDTVQRISTSFFGSDQTEADKMGANMAAEGHIPPSATEKERVARLMENYLSEVASDRNLSVSKFVSLAAHIPEESRTTEDGIYRAIDIYLKAHPSVNDTERKKVCSVMDCHKLSREACAHAAQNDRLPAQTVVQVLYYEQQRLKELPAEQNPKSVDIPAVQNEASSLIRENQDLRLELIKMKLKLNEMEKPQSPGPGSPMVNSPLGKPPLIPKHSFISSVSRKLGKFIGVDSSKTRTKLSRDRRHSIS